MKTIFMPSLLSNLHPNHCQV